MLHKKFVGALAACATLLSALAFTSPAMASGSTVNPLNKAAIALVKKNITIYQNKIVGDESNLAAKRVAAAKLGVIDENGNLTDVCANARGEFESNNCSLNKALSYMGYSSAKKALWKDQNALASAQQQLKELNADFTPEVFANYSGDNPANSLSAKFLIKEINRLKNTITADKSDLAYKRILATAIGTIDKDGNLTDLCTNARGEFDYNNCSVNTSNTYSSYSDAKKTLWKDQNALTSALQQLNELNNSATNHSNTSNNKKVQDLETEIAKDKADVAKYRELSAAYGVIDKNGNLTDLCTNARGEFEFNNCSWKGGGAYQDYLDALQKLAKNKNALAVLRHQLGEDEDDSNNSKNENEGKSNDKPENKSESNNVNQGESNNENESTNESNNESESNNENESTNESESNNGSESNDDESDDYFDFDDFDWDDLDDLLDEIDFDDFDWSSDDYEDTNYYYNDYSYNPYYY